MLEKPGIIIFALLLYLISGAYAYADYYYNYYTYNEMVDLLTDLASQAEMHTPKVFSLQNIGDSFEGHPIYAVKFSDNPELEEESEPVIVIDAGIHGNEIIAQESCINYIQYLFDAYYTPAHPDHTEIAGMIHDLQIWIIPMLNPDGRIQDTDGGDGDPAVHYRDAEWTDGWRVTKQTLPCPEAPGGFVPGANLNRAFPVGFGYDDDCSYRNGYDYGGPAPFMLHESRVMKQFIHNHMVGFVYHQHTPIASAFSKGMPLSSYILNEVIRIYYEGGLPHPKLALLNEYDPAQPLAVPSITTPPVPPDPCSKYGLYGQYNPWLWEETFCNLAPDYFSRRSIPSILFEYPFFSFDYGVPEDGLYGQFDRDDGTDNKHPSSGDTVEWFLERSIGIYNYLVKQSRYVYSPRDYIDMTRKPGPTVEDLALVGAKISEVGTGLPGCLFFDESDGGDLLERGSKRIIWNVQNNGTTARTINSEVSICNLNDDPNCLSATTDIITRSGVGPEGLETFTYDYDFLNCADYAVTLTTGEAVNYDNDLKRFTFTVVAPGDVDCDGALDGDDNCPDHHNPGQEDSSPPGGNGCGDACECEGNFDDDQDQDGSDAATFKVDFGRSIFVDPCSNSDFCSGDFDCDGDVDGTDAAQFKEDFGRSSFSNPCPVCPTEPWCVYP